MTDSTRWAIITWTPRWLCALWWRTEWVPMGKWCPFVLGRILGSEPRKVNPFKGKNNV